MYVGHIALHLGKIRTTLKQKMFPFVSLHNYISSHIPFLLCWTDNQEPTADSRHILVTLV